LPNSGEYTVNGLAVQVPLTTVVASTDYYEVLLPENQQATFDLNFTHADANIEARLFTACTTEVDFSFSTTDGESVTYLNTTSSPVPVQLMVFVRVGGPPCATYGLDVSIVPDPCLSIDDGLEDNDTCFDALPRGANSTTTGLRCLEGDLDWWWVDVPAGSTQTIDVLHSATQADLILAVREECTGGFSNLLALVQTTDDNETYTFTNTSASAERFLFGISIFNDDIGICADYDLVFTNTLAQGSIAPYCFGDGSLAPCPCGNNSTPGHPGGCAHEAGNGARLTGSGTPSISSDSLNMDLTSAVPNTFALLVSGVNPLPQVGCIGCGIPEFDGLRCAGGDLRRLGSRALDPSGDVFNGWGVPNGPPGGLASASNAMAGQTRRYFAFFRTTPFFTCFTGQNSSNGVAVTWVP
ncbi:MAG: hypothetical protein AAF368_12395, partial [Planctomycetota bacterium]